MVIETHMKLCETGPDSSETFFVPKIGKMNSKWAKTVFWICWENLVVNFYWVRSSVKICIICCVPAQISYSETAKMCSVNQIAGFFNCILRTNQWNSLIFCMLIQVPINYKLINSFFKWAWLKMGAVSLVTGL